MPDIENAAAVAETQPTNESVPAGGVEPQRQPLDVENAISGMTDAAEIGNLLFGRETEQPAPAPAATEPDGKEVGEDNQQAEAEPAAELPAGEQPQESAVEDGTPPAEPAHQEAPDRMSLRSLHPDDRILLVKAKEMVREGTAPSLAIAIAALSKPEGQGTPEPAKTETQSPEPAAQTPPQPPPVEIDQTVAEITSRLADLRSQRKAAVEEFDRPKELDLTSQIEDALAELADAKAQTAARNRESTLQQQNLQSVIEDIYVEHPESEDPTSFFSYRMSQELNAYVEAHGPIQRHPQQLKAIAAKVSAELGKAKPAPAQKTAAAPPPKQNLRPVGAAAPGSAASPRTSPDQLQRLIDTASAQDLHAALFGVH